MDKIIEIPFLTPITQEPSITLVRPGYREKYAETKFADEIYKELEEFEGKPDRTYLLLVAVSPKEYYGINRNHDGFSEYWLKKKHHTFCTHGTFYKNHVNKDPSKNYGENVRSWYDDLMKRVLVLVALDNKKAPDLVQLVENRSRIACSMGCKIDHDVCYECGNKAKTRAEYCTCMKTRAGIILPNGIQVGVDNPDPTFFDLSRVLRPAGRIEYSLKHVVPKGIEGSRTIDIWTPEHSEEIEKKEKVAMENTLTPDELYEKEAEFEEKFARLKKLCEMEKHLHGRVISDKELSPKMKSLVDAAKNIPAISETEELPDEDIEQLSSHPLKNIFATSNALGINLKIPEIAKIIVIKIHSKSPDYEELEHNLHEDGFKEEEALSHESPSEYLSEKPDIFKSILKSGIFDHMPEDVSDEVLNILKKWFDKRSMYPHAIEKRAVYGGALDTKQVYDAQGTPYLTTNEAVDRASELGLVRSGLKGLGTAGILGASAYAATKLPFIGSKYMIPAGLVGGAWLSNKLWDKMKMPALSSEVPSDAMVQKISEVVDFKELSNCKIADEQELINSFVPNYHQGNVWDMVRQNPALAIFLGLAGTGAAVGLGAKGLKGMSGLGKKLFPTIEQLSAKGGANPLTERIVEKAQRLKSLVPSTREQMKEYMKTIPRVPAGSTITPELLEKEQGILQRMPIDSLIGK